MKIAVYCGAALGGSDIYAKGATRIGHWIGKSGHTLIYGGGNTGLMGTVADAVLEKGGDVIGVLPDIPLIQGRRHPGLTQYVDAPTMGDRKQWMLDNADAYIALPGGPGTLDELTDIVALARVGKNEKPLILFNQGGYYELLKKFFDNMVEAGFAQDWNFERMLLSDNLDEIEAYLKGFEE